VKVMISPSPRRAPAPVIRAAVAVVRVRFAYKRVVQAKTCRAPFRSTRRRLAGWRFRSVGPTRARKSDDRGADTRGEPRGRCLLVLPNAFFVATSSARDLLRITVLLLGELGAPAPSGPWPRALLLFSFPLAGTSPRWLENTPAISSRAWRCQRVEQPLAECSPRAQFRTTGTLSTMCR